METTVVGYFFGGPNNQDDAMLGSPYFRAVPISFGIRRGFGALFCLKLPHLA